MNERIGKAMRTYHAMNTSIIGKKEISKETKMKIHKTVFRPTLTYGCESRIVTNKLRSKIQAAEMKYPRRVQGVTRSDRIRNVKIREELQIESAAEFIERRQLSWWGHMNRMKECRQVKQVLEARKRGRPRKTWNKSVEKILISKGITWNEAKKLTQNKKEWNKFVHS